MPLTEARKRANAKYNLKAYDRIEVKVPKGQKENIRRFAEQNGESLNAFIGRAIKEAMGEAPALSAAPAERMKKREISVELL